MNATYSFLMADMQRAENEGARTVTVSIRDLKELLPFVESGMARTELAEPMKHAGWIKPGSLQALRSGKKLVTRISRRRHPEFNVEVYFRGDLKVLQAQVIAELEAAQQATTE